MNYYFDIKLNFLNELYNYYEWDKNDNILDIEKIPIIKVSFSDFVKIYTKKIKVNNSFLEKIKNKTKIRKGLLEYSVLFTDSNNTIAILFNEKGESILYSSLSYLDELNIEEIGFKLKKEKIDFEVISNKKVSTKIRFDKEMRNFVDFELKNLIDTKNYSKLKYLYNECNKTSEKELYKIINYFNNIENINNDKFLDLYNLITFYYKNV